MHIHGIKLVEGTRVKNLTVDSGPAFPDLPNTGELFYRTDTSTLFVHNGTNWAAVNDVSLDSEDITTALGYTPVTKSELNLKANTASPTFTGTVSGITKGMVGLGSVDNTSDANKPISTATQTALNTKASIDFVNTSIANLVNSSPTTLDTLSELATALGNDPNFATTTATLIGTKEPIINAGTTSQYFRGDKTWQTLNSSAVGLGNVNNTSDASKPVSTATQSALNLKANLASPTFTGTVSGITKAMVGLGNVDNTSDAAKPISTATQTALNNKANINGDAAQDFYSKALIANTVVGNGVNTVSLAGGDSGVSPSVIARGNDVHVGMYFGIKGQGEYNFADGASATQFRIGIMPNAVNYARVTGGATGGNPGFGVFGSDTNIGMDFTAKGAGEIVYRGNSGIQFKIRAVGTAVNYATVYGAIASGRPTIEAQGSDTDVGIAINTKGLGDVLLASGGRATFKAEGVTNGANYMVTSNAAAGFAPRFTATGSDTNVSMILAFKGNGSLFVDGDMNLRAQAGKTERRAIFNTTNNIHYFYARDSDGVIGLYDLSGGVSPWHYVPLTKTLRLGGNGASVQIDVRTEPNLDDLQGSRFFGFGAGPVPGSSGAAVGAPISAGLADAVGLQMAGAGQRTQLACLADAEGMVIRTDDSPDGENNWGQWKKVWDSGNLTKLSQLTNDSGFYANTQAITGATFSGGFLSETAASLTAGNTVSFVIGTQSAVGVTVTGSSGTIAISAAGSSAQTAIMLLALTNGAAYPFAWSGTINWIKSDGTGATVTNFNDAGYTLKASGVDLVIFIKTRGVIYGRVVR